MENERGFVEALESQLNKTTTENNDVTNISSLDACLDLFATGGAMRNTSENQIEQKFYAAYTQDPLTALRTLFYLRDVRGGQGERRIFRVITRVLAEARDENLILNLQLFPDYGRWDDLIELVHTPIKEEVIQVIKDELNSDHEEDRPSLLGKWLPSENASSEHTRKLAYTVMRGLEMEPKEYRQMLSSMREQLRIVERKMSSNKWRQIEYGHVPSQAMHKYNSAFEKHDPEGFKRYLDSVKKGEAKINASTMYPHQLYERVMQSGHDETTEAQWSALPDYTRGANAIVMADVSGSMMGTPMAVSVSLALYFAERNTGSFKNLFMTFSERPQLVKIGGGTLYDKMSAINRAQWDMNTDLRAAFRAILSAAKADNTPQEELPEVLYVISDMQFDNCVMSSQSTFDDVKAEFERAGYKLPHVVFWNVDARGNETMPVTKRDENVSLVSGFSPTIFRFVVEGKSPVEVMNEAVNSERYQPVRTIY